MHGITDQAHINRRYKLRWLTIIFVIKAILFAYFATQFYQYARTGLVTSGIVVEQADSQSYYIPAETFVNEGEYPGMCRMPGLVPLYAVYSFVMGKQAATVAVVITQFVFSVLSVLLLAIIASRIIPHRSAFPIVAILYALSSFVSIWDHTILSDSFSVSFLIVAVYFITEYSIERQMKFLFWAGFWLTWSIFIRQIGIVFIPLFVLMWWVWNKESIVRIMKGGIVFISPFVILISLWTYHNYQKEKVFVPLIKPIADCWTSYTPQFMRINQLLITWGEDVQYWIAGSPAEWFNKAEKQATVYPFREALYSSVCNADSIMLLQHRYAEFRSTNDLALKQNLGEAVLQQCDRMINSYKSEKPVGYYLVNRLKMVKDFVLPTRLDNTPGPSFSKMNILQKTVKAGYFLLLLLVNFCALWACLLALLKRDWNLVVFSLIPLSLIFVLAFVMGYIEQRYLVPVYPFFVVMCAYLFVQYGERFFRKKITA